MRLHRIITGVVSFAILGVLPLAVEAPAGAADSAAVAAAVAQTSRFDAAPALMARRQIKVKGLEPKPNRFFIKGTVSPTYKKKNVFMLKRVGTGSFKRADKFRTDGRSAFKVRVAGPPRGVKRVCYRALIPAGNGFKKSQSQVLCVSRL